MEPLRPQQASHVVFAVNNSAEREVANAGCHWWVAWWRVEGMGRTSPEPPQIRQEGRGGEGREADHACVGCTEADALLHTPHPHQDGPCV